MRSPLRHVGSLFSKRRPIHLTFFVTRRCNARCPFCFYAEARDAAGGPPELGLDEIRRVARSLDPLLWVLFSGGEPFLRADLVEISQVFHDTNEAAFLTYPTNGLLPETVVEKTEEILERCPGSVVVLKLSLDGVGERHDALRRTPGGFAKLMRTYQGLSALAERYPRLELGVNTLHCPENQGHMDEIVGFVHGLEGVRSHTLTLLRGGPDGPGPGALDLGRYRAACRSLERLWRSRRRRFHRFAGGRLKAAQDRLQRRLIHRTVAERRRVIPCYAGRLNLVLTESGELHPCESRRDRCFGNVRDAGHDVGGMLRSERGREIVDDIAKGDCWCSHECNFITNIVFNPMMQPALLRECARR
ncbi:MAG TPA: radical SAM protein [Candidatus Eisenbacteria bacterium]